MKYSVLRHLMLLFSLIAVLSGTPLRLVEAADDLGRFLAESALEGGLQEIDGGVGDDSGVAIRSVVLQISITSNVLDLMPTWVTRVGLPWPSDLPQTIPPPPRHSQSLLRRHLMILCFLC